MKERVGGGEEKVALNVEFFNRYPTIQSNYRRMHISFHRESTKCSSRLMNSKRNLRNWIGMEVVSGVSIEMNLNT